MQTCPDCGSLIMEGDPYCSHCGAHLSRSDDSSYQRDCEKPDLMGYYDPEEEFAMSEQRRQELLDKICEHYKVKLEDLDVKDTYTEYIFLRKTPYYTLKIVATDQFGGTIGIKREETRVDFTRLLENEKFRKLTENMEYTLSTNLYRDEIGLETEDTFYLLDTDKMELIVKSQKTDAD